MPMITAFLAALGPWIARFFMAKAVLMFAGFMARLGVVIVTNEMFMEPMTNLVLSKWSSLPAGMQCWLGLFGVTKAVSVVLSGTTLIFAKRMLLQKAST